MYISGISTSILSLQHVIKAWFLTFYWRMARMQIPPRGRTQQADRKVQCYEPATMKYLGYYPALTPAEVSDVVLVGIGINWVRVALKFK